VKKYDIERKEKEIAEKTDMRERQRDREKMARERERER
jgi:hypothetical protein